MKKVHCVGIVVVDLLNGPIREYPVPRTRPMITTEWTRVMPGGGASNAPSALARMGIPVSSFSKVGDDLNGEFIRRELRKLGVDEAGFCVSPSESTPFTFVAVHADGERTFIHTPGANLTFAPGDLDLERVFSADYLLYHDLWVLPVFDGKPAASMLAEAQKRGVTTLLDEGYGYGPQRDPLEEMLPHCDYFIPSYHDLCGIYSGASPEEMASALLRGGARHVVLKMGHEGCLVAWNDHRVRVPIFPAKVLDTTGAGDCWDAGFIAALVHGEEIVTAARIGNACSAFGIEAIGGSTGVPDYAAVRQRAGN